MMKDLPKYKCRKEVQALKIADITMLSTGGATITPTDDEYDPIMVSKLYVRKHEPVIGGYYVRYKDGYESFSPAEPFEEGYSQFNPDTDSLPINQDDSIVITARIAHQINKAYCESIGDYSQVDWSDAPDWQKESAINGVKFQRANPNATPEHSHINWLAEKIENGWVYGPEKDIEKKEHPCILPYEDLPEEQRIKDHLFLAVTRL